ncbi:MAG: hypothetical protein HYZ49_02990 [Chloroflexi bacterium]|nr:hypothetical protein [Chloroflexota bacterium]
MTHQLHPLIDPETPDLQIVPLELLVEHEYNDVQRTAPLARRLEAEGLLKNPPIATQLGDPSTLPSVAGQDSRYVVLDGANRTTALMHLGYKHCLVQLVRYEPPQVTLSTWHHLVTGIDIETFSSELDAIDGLDFRESDLLHARAGLARRDLISYTIRADGKVFSAHASDHSIHGKNTLLNAMVDTYKEKGGLFRATTDNLEEARSLYPNLTGLVIFPNYEPVEVMALARDGELMPTGLTRHLIQGRALRLNYPLADLKADESLEAKNARLAGWLKKKMATKEVRYYAEATYLFDE